MTEAEAEALRTAEARIAAESAARTGTLDLNNLGLPYLPDSFFTLTHLRHLDLGVDFGKGLQPNKLNDQRERLSLFTNLETLSVDYSDLTSLTPLTTLTALQSLDCSNTQIIDPSPLQSLTALQRLFCSNTQITDLSPLKSLTGLEVLYCYNTKITDLSPLKSLTNLQQLNCSNTKITDLSPLRSLTALQRLDCNNTQITDLSPIAILPALVALYSRYCMLTFAASLPPALWRDHKSLTRLYLRGTSIPGIPDAVLNVENARSGCLDAIREFFQNAEIDPPPPEDNQPANPPDIPILQKTLRQHQETSKVINSIPQLPTGMKMGGDPNEPIGRASPLSVERLTEGQRDRHKHIRIKAQDLVESCGNSNRLRMVKIRIQSLLAATGDTLDELRIEDFWTWMNFLRNRHAADQLSREKDNPDDPPLPETAAFDLKDLVETLNLFAKDEPGLVSRDQLKSDLKTASPDQQAISDAAQVTESAANAPQLIKQEVSSPLHEISRSEELAGTNPHAERMRQYLIDSVTNLSLEMVRRTFVRGVEQMTKRASGVEAPTPLPGSAPNLFSAQAKFIRHNEGAIRRLLSSFHPAQEIKDAIDFIIARASQMVKDIFKNTDINHDGKA